MERARGRGNSYRFTFDECYRQCSSRVAHEISCGMRKDTSEAYQFANVELCGVGGICWSVMVSWVDVRR